MMTDLEIKHRAATAETERRKALANALGHEYFGPDSEVARVILAHENHGPWCKQIGRDGFGITDGSLCALAGWIGRAVAAERQAWLAVARALKAEETT